MLTTDQETPFDFFRMRMKDAIDIAQKEGVPWQLMLSELLNRVEEIRPDSERY